MGTRRRTTKRNKGHKARRRLGTESLEDRRMMATFSVNPAGGGMTLGDAVFQANSTPGHDVISFNASTDFQDIRPGATYAITDSVTIQGNGADRTVVRGNGTSRLFTVSKDSGPAIEVEFVGLTLADGNSGAIHGGAIMSTEHLTIRDSVLTGNQAGGHGGAVYHTNGSFIMENSTVANNQSDLNGGGLNVRVGADTTFEVTGSTISGNVAGRAAGGLEVWASSAASATIDQSTITQNEAGANPANTDAGGGARLFDGNIEISNSIIADNRDDGAAPDLVGTYGTYTLSYSLLGDNSSTSFAATTGTADANGNLVGSRTDPLSPGLGPLRDNGGTLPTHNPLNLSPAVDAADPTVITDWTDREQRGSMRGMDGDGDGVVRMDMGAVERFSMQGRKVDSTNDELDGRIAWGDVTLREAVMGLEYDPVYDTVEFATGIEGETIELDKGELYVHNTSSIIGPGASRLTIDSTTNDRIFYIDGQSTGHREHVEISGLRLTGGSALFGGAIASRGDLTLEGMVITNSSALSGGAVHSNGGSLIVGDSTFHANSAALNGGAITIVNTDFGDYNAFVNTTITDNEAGTGGGVYLSNDETLTIIQYTTITDNSASTTGGIEAVSGSNFVLHNSIVAGNFGDTFRDLRTASGSTVGTSYSLIGNGADAGLTGAVFNQDADGNYIGTAGIYLDPQLEVLAMNGGQTPTRLPMPGSRVVDAGEPGTGLDHNDQRGMMRTVDGDSNGVARTDMGAAEYAPEVPLVVTTATDEVDGRIFPGALSLREAIILANTQSGADTIRFADEVAGMTINVGDAFHITDSLVIDGPGADQLVLNGGAEDRLFYIDDGGYFTQIDVTLRGLAMTNGSAEGETGIYGGGAISSRENLAIHESTLSGNHSNGAGGAIFARDGSFEFSHSAAWGNTSTAFGGALAVILPHDASALIESSTISGNEAAIDGGGIDVAAYFDSSSISVRNSTITNNVADSNANGSGFGGGIRVFEGQANVENTIIAGNRNNAGTENGVDLSGHVNLSYSLVGDLQGSSLVESQTPDADGNLIGNSLGDGVIEPGLGGLAANGGSSPTHALLPSSRARNMGSMSVNGDYFDQRGPSYDRVADGRRDIGAFEVQPEPLTDADFDDNGVYDCSDVDSLVSEIAGGNFSALYDLNQDGTLNRDDLNAWLAEAGWHNLGVGQTYLAGDANLDGVVDVSDFNVWNSNKFIAHPSWCSGDFNADGVVDVSDFNSWNANKFSSSGNSIGMTPSTPNRSAEAITTSRWVDRNEEVRRRVVELIFQSTV
ncbi:MAG: choice-of-anchor Q domain-containing protein [Planctomycetota bacterium]